MARNTKTPVRRIRRIPPRKVILPVSLWPIRWPESREVDEGRQLRVQIALRRVVFQVGPRTVISLQSSMPADVDYEEIEEGCLALVKSGEWTQIDIKSSASAFGPVGLIDPGLAVRPLSDSRSVAVAEDEVDGEVVSQPLRAN